MRRLALLALALAAACSDALEQTSSAGQYVGFVTQDNYLLLLSATDLTQRLVQLEFGPGSGQRLTARGSVFLASIPGSARLDIVDLADNPDTVRRIGLAEMEPVDAAMADDSIAWVVAPPYVVRVNYRAGALGDMVFIGGTASLTAVAVTAQRVFVLRDAGLSSPGYITVVDPVAHAVVDSVLLTPARPRLAVVGDDSLLYVVSTRAGTDSGRVSVVNPIEPRELLVINGIGSAPLQAQFHPSGSRLLVASAFSGIQEVNTITKTLTRPPSDAIRPGGHAVAGIVIDQGRLIYAADSACAVDVLQPPPDYTVRKVVSAPGAHCPWYGAVATKP